VHEYILVFSKGSFKRQKPEMVENTITKEQFMEWTKSVWSMPPESARKVGHPAPFPVELPYRLVQLYTFPGDVVLDPFMGSGATALAALKAGRSYIGYEIDAGYAALAEKRIQSLSGAVPPLVPPFSRGKVQLNNLMWRKWSATRRSKRDGG
jgi:DNA modification methylase